MALKLPKLPPKRSPIGGWKTKLAAFSCIAYGIGGLYLETHGMDRMIELLIYAMGMLGLGHKIERAGAAYEEAKQGNLADIVKQSQSD